MYVAKPGIQRVYKRLVDSDADEHQASRTCLQRCCRMEWKLCSIMKVPVLLHWSYFLGILLLGLYLAALMNDFFEQETGLFFLFFFSYCSNYTFALFSHALIKLIVMRRVCNLDVTHMRIFCFGVTADMAHYEVIHYTTGLRSITVTVSGVLMNIVLGLLFWVIWFFAYDPKTFDYIGTDFMESFLYQGWFLNAIVTVCFVLPFFPLPGAVLVYSIIHCAIGAVYKRLIKMNRINRSQQARIQDSLNLSHSGGNASVTPPDHLHESKQPVDDESASLALEMVGTPNNNNNNSNVIFSQDIDANEDENGIIPLAIADLPFIIPHTSALVSIILISCLGLAVFLYVMTMGTETHFVVLTVCVGVNNVYNFIFTFMFYKSRNRFIQVNNELIQYKQETLKLLETQSDDLQRSETIGVSAYEIGWKYLYKMKQIESASWPFVSGSHSDIFDYKFDDGTWASNPNGIVQVTAFQAIIMHVLFIRVDIRKAKPVKKIKQSSAQDANTSDELTDEKISESLISPISPKSPKCTNENDDAPVEEKKERDDRMQLKWDLCNLIVVRPSNIETMIMAMDDEENGTHTRSKKKGKIRTGLIDLRRRKSGANGSKKGADDIMAAAAGSDVIDDNLLDNDEDKYRYLDEKAFVNYTWKSDAKDALMNRKPKFYSMETFHNHCEQEVYSVVFRMFNPEVRKFGLDLKLC